MIWAGIIFCTVAAQSAIGVRFLDLSIIPVYWLGIRRGGSAGMLAGIFTGILEDSLAGRILGPAILSKTWVGILSSYLRDGILLWRPLLGILFIIMLTLLDQTLMYLSLTIFASRPFSLRTFILLSLLGAFVNSPAGAYITVEEGHGEEQ